MNIFQPLHNTILQSNPAGSYIAEIIAMLLGAFLFGYLFRHFLNVKFKRRIKQLEEEVLQLKHKITSLEANNAQLTNDLDQAVIRTIHLGNDLTITSGKLNVAEASNVKLTGELGSANNKIQSLVEESTELKNKLDEFSKTHELLKTEIQNHLTEINELRLKIGSDLERKSPGGKSTSPK